MRTINTGYISDPLVQQPFTGPSLDFLQQANLDTITALVSALAPTYFGVGTWLKLNGCVKTFDGTDYNITEGWLVHLTDMKIYYMDPFTGPLTDTFVLKKLTTQDATADPLLFTDNISRNVHNIETVYIQDTTTGSGLIDFDDISKLRSEWYVVGDNGPAYLNSWQENTGSGYPTTPLSFKFDFISGMLSFRGGCYLSGGYPGGYGTDIFRLPTIYRPTIYKRYVPVIGFGDAETWCEIGTDGYVVINTGNATPGADLIANFDGINIPIYDVLF